MAKATVGTLKQRQDTPLAAHDLIAFFSGSDAQKASEKIAQAEQPRLAYLFRKFDASDTTSIKEAVKGLKEAAEKEHGAKSPQHKTAGVRASEIQTLYGAHRFADLKEPNGGYHGTVASARDTLKAKGIRWTGERIAEKWERDVRKRVEGEANVSLAVEMEREQYKRANNGEEPSDDQLEAFRAKTIEATKRSGAVQMARKLYEKQGAEFCGWLVDALEAIMSEVQEEEKQGSRKAA